MNESQGNAGNDLLERLISDIGGSGLRIVPELPNRVLLFLRRLSFPLTGWRL